MIEKTLRQVFKNTYFTNLIEKIDPLISRNFLHELSDEVNRTVEDKSKVMLTPNQKFKPKMDTTNFTR